MMGPNLLHSIDNAITLRVKLTLKVGVNKSLFVNNKLKKLYSLNYHKEFQQHTYFKLKWCPVSTNLMGRRGNLCSGRFLKTRCSERNFYFGAGQ